MSESAAVLSSLDASRGATQDECERLERDGFAILRGVLDPAEIAAFEPTVSSEARARAWNRDIPLEKRGTYDKAFLQAGNLWRHNAVVRQLSFAPRLARLAAELMGVAGVRMYHDQALYKEPGYGITPWHVDQQYWPLASDRAVTAWIPMQDTPLEMGPVAFGRGTHRLEVGRGLPIGDESEAVISRVVEEQGIEDAVEPFRAGDVSFHLGWTLHHAGANVTDVPRCVHTVIYIDADMRLSEPANPFQRFDWQTWSPGTEVGAVMDDPLNPVLWRRDALAG